MSGMRGCNGTPILITDDSVTAANLFKQGRELGPRAGRGGDENLRRSFQEGRRQELAAGARELAPELLGVQGGGPLGLPGGQAGFGNIQVRPAVAAADAAKVLEVMRSFEHGRDAVIIGSVVDLHPGMVVMRTAFGSQRIIDLPLGEQLPRIC